MFNHYHKLKRLIAQYPKYQILKINKPTKTKRFDGEYNYYDYYYRLVNADGTNIKYGKFQQLDKLASVLQVDIGELEAKVIEEKES